MLWMRARHPVNYPPAAACLTLKLLSSLICLQLLKWLWVITSPRDAPHKDSLSARDFPLDRPGARCPSDAFSQKQENRLQFSSKWNSPNILACGFVLSDLWAKLQSVPESFFLLKRHQTIPQNTALELEVLLLEFIWDRRLCVLFRPP